VGVKRKQQSADFKARVAMAALSGERTLAEVSSEFGVHPTMISTWMQELTSELFARGNKAVDDTQKVIDDLHRKIGSSRSNGSVRGHAGRCSLRSDGRAGLIRRLATRSLRSQCGGGSGACGCWRKYVDEGESGDGGGYAIHRSLDRTGQPIVGI
jgi:transposase